MIEIAMVVAAVALLGVIVVALQLNGMRRRLDAMPADENVFDILRGIDNELGRLDSVTTALEPRLAAVEHLLPHAIVHTGVVNYDAFGDITGNQSRSLAFLDSRGSGVVLTILVGRAEMLFYTKEIKSGQGTEQLSPEEHSAIAKAMGR